MQPTTTSIRALYRGIRLVTAMSGLTIAIGIQSCGVDKPAEIVQVAATLPETIDYNLHVKPILSDKCFFCHGPDKNSQKAGLELATREGALAALKKNSSKNAIVPGDLNSSEVYHRIISKDEHDMMPPRASNRVLSVYEKAVLIKWIEQGGDYKPHWALIKPKKADIPAVRNSQWPVNAIDYFTLHKMEEKGLKPAPEADKETLCAGCPLISRGCHPPSTKRPLFWPTERLMLMKKSSTA